MFRELLGSKTGVVCRWLGVVDKGRGGYSGEKGLCVQPSMGSDKNVHGGRSRMAHAEAYKSHKQRKS